LARINFRAFFYSIIVYLIYLYIFEHQKTKNMKNRITQFDRFIIRSTFIGICITIIAVMNTKSKIETKKHFEKRIESLELDSIRTHEMLQNYSINHQLNSYE